MSVVVLLHAFGSSHRAWAPQIDVLGDRYRLMTPDLPGHGDAPGPFSVQAATGSIGELLAAESEPAHLVAISGSVSVALLVALEHPDRVASLVLSGGVAHTGTSDRVQRLLMKAMPSGVMVRMLKGMYSGGQADHAETAVADLRHAGKRTILAGLHDLADLDLRPRLAEVKAPALVLCGEKDKANVAPARELAAGLPHAELKIVPGVGHIWNLEDPALFSRTVSDFVDRVDSERIR